jgi:hypothetical protein
MGVLEVKHSKANPLQALLALLNTAVTPWNPSGDNYWRDNALCKGSPTPVWVPNDYDEAWMDQRRRDLFRNYCTHCPVRSDCLRSSLGTDPRGADTVAIYAGTTPSERYHYRQELLAVASMEGVA